MHRDKTVSLIIPALDEEGAIGPLLRRVPRPIVDHMIVADNGSRDATAERARQAGAVVVIAPRRGYGSACLAGIAEARRLGTGLYAFLDGDGSDDPSELPLLLECLSRHELDLVIGSRVLGDCEKGALTPVQIFGNWLTCNLVRLFWGVRYSDLGPFRLVTAEALDRLEMADPDFGWTVEMQVKAAQLGMRVRDVPVSRAVRRAGQSKVSGTISGSFHAGRRILSYVVRAKLAEQNKPRGKSASARAKSRPSRSR